MVVGLGVSGWGHATLPVEVAALQQGSIALPDLPVQRGRFLHPGEGHGPLVEQDLQARALATLVQHQQQVGGVGDDTAGAESALALGQKVGGREGGHVSEEAQEGEQGEEGLAVAHLDSDRLRHLAQPGGEGGKTDKETVDYVMERQL